VLKDMQVVPVDHIDSILEQVLLPAVDSDEEAAKNAEGDEPEAAET